MALRHEEVRKMYRFDEFQIDARKQVLLRHGKPVTLNAKAFNLLLVLVSSGGRELSKDELMHLVWQDQIVEENNLAVHIYNLRKILGERKDEHRYIITIPGVGYRFVADVLETPSKPDELFIESHTVSRVVVEEEGTNPTVRESVIAGVNLTPSDKGESVNTKAVSLPYVQEAAKSTAMARLVQSPRRKFVWPAALIFVLFLAAGLSGYRLYRSGLREAPGPAPGFHRQIAFTRLTNSGQIDDAAISPDGKYVAYTSGESQGNSLWLRQTGTASDIRLLPPTKAEFWGLTFSPDGRFIYYNLYSGDHVDFELFRVPSLGGIVEKIPNVSSRAIAFSPDGKRIAYIQSESDSGFNALMVAEADGNHQQILARKEYPNTFNTEGQGIAWSPDGNTIAGLVNQFEADASYFTIVGINAKDGTEKPLSERRWYEVSGIEWLKNGSGLLLSAKENLLEPVQIWLLPYPQGEARQVTKDVNQYGSLSLTADGESLAAVQRNIVNGIFVGEVGGDDFKEIASEVGALDPLAWTPDGKIVFRSSRDGVANLWVMDADGTGRRQLTVNAHVDSRGLSVSPDGRYIVFVSWRSGKMNLWRIDADGGNLIQLTDGEGDVYPRCTPDGASVIFQRGIYSKPMLWKVSLAGGAAQPLTDFRAKWAAISNDGSRLSYFQMADGKWRIGIIPSAGGAPLQRLDAPANLKQSTVTWSPDNQALFYIGVTGNVGNVWSLPFDGAAARPLTAFTSHWLADFSLSRDGRQLAVTRSRSVSDVVLLKNAASP
jgi:Tol biopolymer transport system component/DNA-binding winged helix-turn-helix (wHTH) protein